MGKALPSYKESDKLFKGDIEAIAVLKAEGKKLEECAKKVWRLYLSSYQPKVYAVHKTNIKGERTHASLASIKLGDVKRVGQDEYQIEVTFLNDLAYHDSVIGNKRRKHKQGHAIMLISFGWRVRKGAHRNVKHFGYRQGYDYLGKVARMYNKKRDKRVSLEIQWLGKKDYLRR